MAAEVRLLCHAFFFEVASVQALVQGISLPKEVVLHLKVSLPVAAQAPEVQVEWHS